MPKPSWYRSWLGFKSPRRFANDMLHELVHWSGGARRLSRPLPREQFDPIYNREELIAELGAAILARDLGVARATMLPHARYLDGFLKTLINPEVELSAALTAANRSVGFLCSLARAELV